MPRQHGHNLHHTAGLHSWTTPSYGQRIQYASDPDSVTLASKQDITWLQGIVGTLLYNARAVGPTSFVPLSVLASQFTTATSETMHKVDQICNYCCTLTHATIRYNASDMQLKIHSDASYLSEPKAKSRVCVYVFLGNNNANKTPSLTNGPLLCISTVLKYVVSSVAESEFGATLIMAKEGTATRTILEEMGHHQEAMKLTTDNYTDDGIIYDTVQKICSKAIDMRFYWIKDRGKQGQFKLGWAPGDTSTGDYFTKLHSPAHHKRMQPHYLHSDAAPMIRHDSKASVLRGCLNLCTLSPASRPQAPTARVLSAASHRWPAEHSRLSAARHRHTPEECARATGLRTGYSNTL
jgi:hypothetical protein